MKGQLVGVAAQRAVGAVDAQVGKEPSAQELNLPRRRQLFGAVSIPQALDNGEY